MLPFLIKAYIIKTYISFERETFSFRRWTIGSSVRLVGGQKGQTMVEYILLLVVVVTLAYMLGRNFFQPLKNYGSSVFTNTIACALEYGQLPAAIVTEEGCSASMNAGAGGTSGGARRKGGGSKDGSSSTTPTKEDKKSQEPGGEHSTSDSSSPSSRSQVSTISGRSGTLQLGRATGVEDRGSKITSIANDDEFSGAKEFEGYAGGLGIKRRKPRYKALDSEVAEEFVNRKKKSKAIDTGVRSPSSGEGAEGGKPKRLTLSNQKNDKNFKVTEEDWDMSKMIRMALIVLMILAILIFVFFQVSQIRRGSSSA
jgi:hypothetical protein